jgi:hypothetical protein
MRHKYLIEFLHQKPLKYGTETSIIMKTDSEKQETTDLRFLLPSFGLTRLDNIHVNKRILEKYFFIVCGIEEWRTNWLQNIYNIKQHNGTQITGAKSSWTL